MAKEWFRDFPPQVVDALRLLDKATRATWFEDDDGVNRPHFSHERVARFYRWARTNADSMGYAVEALAVWLRERPGQGSDDVKDRLIESGFLRALVLVYTDQGYLLDSISESRVAHGGEFMGRLAVSRELRKFVLNWAIDVGERDDPTAVIRGVLMSSGFAEYGGAKSFWDEAMRSGQRFPMRIFMDPCPAAEGYYFTSYQCRCFARQFRLMSSAVREYFATYMAHNALFARVFVTHEDRNGVTTRREVTEPVKEQAQVSVLRTIAGMQPEAVRRQLMYIFDV